MSVEISIDQASYNRLMGQLDDLKKKAGVGMYQAITTAALAIRNKAMLRLKEKGHIITSRLINSIVVKGKDQISPSSSYKCDTGSFDGDLRSVTINGDFVAVGTNVEYAGAIEFGRKAAVINGPIYIKNVGWRWIKTSKATSADSFLYYAFKNVDITASVEEEMRKIVAADAWKNKGVSVGPNGGTYTVSPSGRKNYFKQR